MMQQFGDFSVTLSRPRWLARLRYYPVEPFEKKGARVLAVVWSFQVRKGREDEFEQLHGADGEWTALSRRSRSFLGSSFLRELADPRRYLLTEYWSEMVIYEKHLRDFGDEMTDLQTRRSEMVSETTPIGLFEGLDVPDRFGPTWSRRDGR
jgi:hypothetical protein